MPSSPMGVDVTFVFLDLKEPRSPKEVNVKEGEVESLAGKLNIPLSKQSA